MGTNKPILQVIMEEETLKHFTEICKEEKRSKSNLACVIIEEWIKEREHKKSAV